MGGHFLEEYKNEADVENVEKDVGEVESEWAGAEEGGVGEEAEPGEREPEIRRWWR